MKIKRSHWFLSILLMMLVHGAAIALMLNNDNHIVADGGAPSGNPGMNVSFSRYEEPVQAEKTVTEERVAEEAVQPTELLTIKEKPKPKPKVKAKPRNKPPKIKKTERKKAKAIPKKPVKKKTTKKVVKKTTDPVKKKQAVKQDTKVQTLHSEQDRVITAMNSNPGDEGNASGQGTGKTNGVGSGNIIAAQNYNSILLAWLEKHKRYPRKALRKRIEGEGMLYFKLDQSGNVVAHEIRKKTGSRILDREIMKMLKRASPMPTDAQVLARNSEFVIPITFSIYSH